MSSNPKTLQNTSAKDKAGPKGQKQRKPAKNVLPIAKSDKSLFLQLSPCASKYAISLEAPWLPLENVCVPVVPAFPSTKIQTWIRGTAFVGTSGVGFVSLACHNTAASNNVPGHFSDATWAGTAISNSPGSGVVAMPGSNSPYQSSQWSAGPGVGLASRLVSGGMRIRYTGKELDKAGSIYLLESPTHASLVGFNVANLAALRETNIVAPSRGWAGVTIHPMDAAELNFLNTAPSYGPMLGILFTGTPGTSFDFEACCNFEFRGQPAANAYTPSEEDAQGFGYVESAARLAKTYLKPSANCAATVAEAARNVMQGLEAILPMAATYVASAGFALRGVRLAVDALQLQHRRLPGLA